MAPPLNVALTRCGGGGVPLSGGGVGHRAGEGGRDGEQVGGVHGGRSACRPRPAQGDRRRRRQQAARRAGEGQPRRHVLVPLHAEEGHQAHRDDHVRQRGDPEQPLQGESGS